LDIDIHLTGATPLLMHNPRMVDPEYPLNREIKAISKKRNKTTDDYAQMEMLEWFGGLYDENGVVVQPTSKVRKCLIETARISKMGKNVERSLIVTSLNEPLIYEGPTDPKEIWETGNGYVSRLSVGIGRSRVMRVRPQFHPWELTVPAVLLEGAGLDLDELERIVKLAGQATGIGDGRAIGYGRFDGEVIVK
jgi:hypothetical protein